MAYEDIVHAANLRCRRMRMKYEEVVVLNAVHTDSRIALHMRVVEWRRGHQALTSAQINIRKIKCQFYAIRFFFFVYTARVRHELCMLYGRYAIRTYEL